MKKRIFCLMAAVAALAVAGCAKEHQCKCEATETADTEQRILTVDGQMKCESITELGFEEKYVAEDGTHSLRRVQMQKVSCRNYAE